MSAAAVAPAIAIPATEPANEDTVTKDEHPADPPVKKAEASKAVKKAAKRWREAKAKERQEREELASLVRELVAAEVLSENKISSITDIPRMTIRKMLGKP